MLFHHSLGKALIGIMFCRLRSRCLRLRAADVVPSTLRRQGITFLIMHDSNLEGVTRLTEKCPRPVNRQNKNQRMAPKPPARRQPTLSSEVFRSKSLQPGASEVLTSDHGLAGKDWCRSKPKSRFITLRS